jgi:hypothetical protein
MSAQPLALVVFGPFQVSAAQETFWYFAYGLPLWIIVAIIRETIKVPRSPAKNSRMVEAFVSRMDSISNLPWESNTATEIVAW